MTYFTMRALILFLGLALCCSCSAKNLTLVSLVNGPKTGAVCLDGSPPGYYIREGSGDGANKWIVHLGGGGWCYSLKDCYNRSKTVLGTSTVWPPSGNAGGFLSDNKSVNPDFYNWNIVYVMYCDGASFAGYVKEPVKYNSTSLYFRGRKVLIANLDDLLDKGMKSATEVILTGCSAGGLATYLHADFVKSYIPKNIKFRAMADAGYFLDIKTVNGAYLFREAVQAIVKMQNVSGGMNQDCLKAFKMEPWKCFFAPYSFPYIKTPVFLLNSVDDTAQLTGILQLPCLPPNCSNHNLGFFYDFVVEFLEQALVPISSNNTGVFLDSCLIHCQTLTDKPWMSYSVNGRLMRDTFADWYLRDEMGIKKVDSYLWPDNPSCGSSPAKYQDLWVTRLQ